jgi:hypothetical protein
MGRLVVSRVSIDFSLLELDDDGEPVREFPQHPITLHGIRQVQAWLDELPVKVNELHAQLVAGGNGKPD